MTKDIDKEKILKWIEEQISYYKKYSKRKIKPSKRNKSRLFCKGNINILKLLKIILEKSNYFKEKDLKENFNDNIVSLNKIEFDNWFNNEIIKTGPDPIWNEGYEYAFNIFKKYIKEKEQEKKWKKDNKNIDDYWKDKNILEE